MYEQHLNWQLQRIPSVFLIDKASSRLIRVLKEDQNISIPEVYL